MDAFILFPETIPYDKDLGMSYALRIQRDPKPRMIQGKSLEAGLWQHQRQFTTVIETDESEENRWWDGMLPLLRSARMDPKSRGANTGTYTVSDNEKAKQLAHNGLFIWPLYKVDGTIFVRECVLAKFRGTELIGPPALTRSKHEVMYGKQSWFWGVTDLTNRETLALTQINEMNLLQG